MSGAAAVANWRRRHTTESLPKEDPDVEAAAEAAAVSGLIRTYVYRCIYVLSVCVPCVYVSPVYVVPV